MINIRQKSKSSNYKQAKEIGCQTSKVDFIDRDKSNLSLRKSPTRKLSHLRAATFRSPKRKASLGPAFFRNETNFDGQDSPFRLRPTRAHSERNIFQFAMNFGKTKNLDDLYEERAGSPDRRSEKNFSNKEFDLYGSIGGYNNYTQRLYR